MNLPVLSRIYDGLRCLNRRWVRIIWLTLLLFSCSHGGDSDNLPSSPTITPVVKQQAIENILEIYRTALVQEDIDRLQTILEQDSNTIQPTVQDQDVTPTEQQDSLDPQAFLDLISATFQNLTLLDLQLLNIDIDIAEASATASFLEARSVIDPVLLEQRTHVVRTALEIVQAEQNGVEAFRIRAISRQSPEFEIITPGQIVAGMPARIVVSDVTGTFALTDVDIDVPDTGESISLAMTEDVFHGSFSPPLTATHQPLRITLSGPQGDDIVMSHPYRLRVPGEGVVEKISGTDAAEFFAVAAAPDGTIYAGGRIPGFLGGTLFVVPAGASRFSTLRPFFADPRGLITDLVFDHLDRLQVALFSPQAPPSEDQPISAQTSGVGILDVDAFSLCQTVNVFDPLYPFTTPEGNPSPSTQLLATAEGHMWLFGSDGGAGRVTDTVQGSTCENVSVAYESIFRRDTNPPLPTNTVPALVVGSDASIWFGTALGLTRLQNGVLQPIPFQKTLNVTANPATLEQFFQSIADAIFAARPISSVAIGDESFIDTFGRALIKEDLIFSAIETAPGTLWAGTLGGGLRRIDTMPGGPADTLHLTRMDGLGSNIILSLAEAPEDRLWLASDEGASEFQMVDEVLQITNFSALDGLTSPVRDLLVDGEGILWFATARGLFRLVQQGSTIRGTVQDQDGTPVAGADVELINTPFRTVTDEAGHFVVTHLPLGVYQLQIDPRLSSDPACVDSDQVIEINVSEQEVGLILLTCDSAHRLSSGRVKARRNR